MSYLLAILVNLVHLAIQAYIIVIFVRALVSWVSPDPSNPIVRFLYRVTEPVLRPIRHRLPTTAMGIDLSPLVAFAILMLIDNYVVVPVLYSLGSDLR